MYSLFCNLADCITILDYFETIFRHNFDWGDFHLNLFCSASFLPSNYATYLGILFLHNKQNCNFSHFFIPSLHFNFQHYWAYMIYITSKSIWIPCPSHPSPSEAPWVWAKYPTRVCFQLPEVCEWNILKFWIEKTAIEISAPNLFSTPWSSNFCVKGTQNSSFELKGQQGIYLPISDINDKKIHQEKVGRLGNWNRRATPRASLKNEINFWDMYCEKAYIDLLLRFRDESFHQPSLLLPVFLPTRPW